jgi:hypothetical protein
VESHILEVARWEREEIARQIARVRREAERRLQAGAWHGCRLGKQGRSWARVPAQEDLFAPPLSAGADDDSSEPENSFTDCSPAAKPEDEGRKREAEPEEAVLETLAPEHIRRVFAGTGKGIPTEPQIAQALACLPRQATTQGFAGFVRAKLPAIRHAGALVRLAEEYAHEIRFRSPPPVFRCRQCRDEGFVLPGGQFCTCPVGLRRRGAEERGLGAGP